MKEKECIRQYVTQKYSPYLRYSDVRIYKIKESEAEMKKIFNDTYFCFHILKNRKYKKVHWFHSDNSLAKIPKGVRVKPTDIVHTCYPTQSKFNKNIWKHLRGWGELTQVTFCWCGKSNYVAVYPVKIKDYVANRFPATV